MGLLEWIKLQLGFDHEEQGYWYVYEIISPLYTPPKVKYIGKGERDRMYQHAKDARRLLKLDKLMELSCKHKGLIEIWDAGLQERYHIVFRTNDECKAYQVESWYIEKIGLSRLWNENYGYTKAAIKRCKDAVRRRGELVVLS